MTKGRADPRDEVVVALGTTSVLETREVLETSGTRVVLPTAMLTGETTNEAKTSEESDPLWDPTDCAKNVTARQFRKLLELFVRQLWMSVGQVLDVHQSKLGSMPEQLAMYRPLS